MKQFLVKYTAPTHNGTIIGESRVYALTKISAQCAVWAARPKAQIYSVEEGFMIGERLYYGNGH